MTTRRIDLHAHTSASDGTTAPADLVREAAATGLDVVALTDHDTTKGWAEAQAALPSGLTLVPGIELSCRSADISAHVLGFLFDPEEPDFAVRRRELRDSRVFRAERMVRALEADGLPVTWERVQELAGGTVGRPHIAQALLEQGLVASVSDAFTLDWIGTRGRYWVDKLEIDVIEAVGLITAAGGVAVFAHPAAVKRDRTLSDEVIVAMAEAGLAGLEVDHVDHDDAARTHLRGLAAELGLLVTGGSDFHGTNKTVRLGAHLTDEAAYEQIVARATAVSPVSG